MDNNVIKFWKKRSQYYNQLEWAIKGGYLKAFIEAADFKEDDFVLDVGTGTGIIAHTISGFVKRVIGIDISPDMLEQAYKNRTNKEEFLLMDARDLLFKDNLFTKITARMVFHHIIEKTEKAMQECFRVLKKGGSLIFSEGVPPTEHVREFYTEMFKLKEERLVFYPEDLERLVLSAGFKIIKNKVYWSKRCSIKNWLENSGLDKEIQDKIFQMHRNLDPQGKKDYNMEETEDDCFIDMKFIIIVAEKE